MKTLCSLAAVFLVVAGWCALPELANAEPGDIVARRGKGSSPKWSPDGNLIAYVLNGELRVAPSDGSGSGVTVAEYAGGDVVWADADEIIYVQRPRSRSDSVAYWSVRIDMDTDEESGTLEIWPHPPEHLPAENLRGNGELSRPTHLIVLPDGTPVCIRSRMSSPEQPPRFEPLHANEPSVHESEYRTVVTRKEGESRPSPSGNLWIVPVFDEQAPGRQLTHGEEFYLIKMAPGGDRFVAACAGRHAWVVFDTSGRELNGEFAMLGEFDQENRLYKSATGLQWSLDGRWLCYLIGWDDGHYESDHLLMISDIGESQVTQLIGSEHGDIPLGGYSWSPSGDRIAVATEQSGILVLEISR